ncbi:uncharacterized protein A4U43_C04F26450 [Asparagus officinalis]|uniref:Aminotransferase-like plant mobile domain-containing protein n=1 Tax=Asparagus officinalis TaxID=4686 RepID=A0A5P1F4J3_ASPOF|nr:uncharacterized protein A4U43_C04F26450 [Asparagus officinalis]
MPATRHRFYGWVHSLDKLWWASMTKYVLSRWSEELHACGLYAAIRSTMYGLPVSAKHFFALCELYNPDSNTFLTKHGELGLALHEMHRISGLPMGQMLYQENLESTSGEAICELATLTPSEVNGLLKKIDAHSYTISSPESDFPAGTKFKSFLWHATASIQPMTLLAGYLAIWLKKCMVPYQSGDIMPLEVLYPAVKLAYKKELSLLPVMVANIHRGLRQISSTFTQKEDAPSAKIPLTKVELPYTYLMAWPGYLTFRVRNQCFIEPYLPCRFARQFGYDQLYVGNPRQQLRTHGGLVDGLRAWLWTVTGCTGAKFSLPSAERQLNLTFLSCRWLLAANKTIPVKPIEELVAEEASQVDSRVIWENARSQRTRSKTRRIDEEGKKIFHSADEASGGDLEDYEDCSERGERGDSEMSPDPAPHDCVFSGEPDSPHQVEKSAEAADVRETINVGPDSANPDKLQEANVDLGNREANTPIRGLLVDTPMLHFMYGSPHIDDQMPEDMFPESTLPKNPEDGPSEGTYLFSS